ncbi:hypothetical protein Tco_0324483 [Tanacetum coccineum]
MKKVIMLGYRSLAMVCFCILIDLDPRKSIHYKVVLAERPSDDTWIHIYSSEIGKGLNRELKHYRLNIEDNDHPIMTTLDIPHGLHRGRNFLESFGGHSNNPMLLLMEIPHILSCRCLLLVCKDDIGSNDFTIYEIMKGSSVWSIREDAFVVINISGKVVKYHLISKTTTEIFDIGSNQMDDDDDDDDDAVEFIPPFEVNPNIYKFISSLACV